jgi:hypothetical protein
MNEPIKLFIRGSRRFCEGLDRIQASVGEPDESKIAHYFGSHKWQIENLDELVKCGKLRVGEAEESRLRIEILAWYEVYKYVLNSWNTSDKLAAVLATFLKASGEDLHIPDVDKDRRSETLRELNDLRHVMIMRHQAAC